MWITGKRMKIQRGAGYVWLNPGDPVPEAENWHNKTPWINGGFIKKSRRVEMPVDLVEPEVVAVEVAPPPVLEPEPEPEPEPEREIKIDVGVMEATVKAGEDDEFGTEDDTVSIKPKKKIKLKGPGKCPHCGGDFFRLERHKCKMVPRK